MSTELKFREVASRGPLDVLLKKIHMIKDYSKCPYACTLRFSVIYTGSLLFWFLFDVCGQSSFSFSYVRLLESIPRSVHLRRLRGQSCELQCP